VVATTEGVFELTVMFFGLTNLLVTFQVIRNDLLRNMIETGVKVAERGLCFFLFPFSFLFSF